MYFLPKRYVKMVLSEFTYFLGGQFWWHRGLDFVVRSSGSGSPKSDNVRMPIESHVGSRGLAHIGNRNMTISHRCVIQYGSFRSASGFEGKRKDLQANQSST